MLGRIASKQQGRAQIKASESGPHQLARHLTLGAQKAHHVAGDFVEQHSTELAQAGLVSGAVALAALLLKHRRRGTRGGGRQTLTPEANFPCAQNLQDPAATSTEQLFFAFLDAYYDDNNENSYACCCQHLRALHSMAKPKGKEVRQELYDLKVLEFLIDEMKFVAMSPAAQPPPRLTANGPATVDRCSLFTEATWPPCTQAAAPIQSMSPEHACRSHTTSPISSNASPSKHVNHQTHVSARADAITTAASPSPGAKGSSGASPSRFGSGVTNSSPSKRVPALPESSTMEDAASRDGSVHVPVSAPTSSFANSVTASPVPVRRALPLTHSPSANRAPSLPHLARPLNPLSSQFSASQSEDDSTPKIQAEYSRPQRRRSSDDFPDENRPLSASPHTSPHINSSGPGEETFGHLNKPAGYISTGDLNADVERMMQIEDDIANSLDGSDDDYDDDIDGPAVPSPRRSPDKPPARRPTVPRLGLTFAGTRSRPEAPSLALPVRAQSADQAKPDRRIYKDAERHLLMVELALELLVNSAGELDPAYCKSNLSEEEHVSFLQQHLSSSFNADLTDDLSKWAKDAGDPTQRLLRLVCRFLFDANAYQDRRRIAMGAYSQVHTCCVVTDAAAVAPELALKISDLPCHSAFQRGQLTAFTEIGIMQRLQPLPGVCKLHSYGIGEEGIYLVMTKYSCSLRDWREKQQGDPCKQLKLYLNIFCQLAECVQAVTDEDVVHFDLKGDNILLEKLPGAEEEEFWRPDTDQPAFRVVLADFGDSCDFSLSEQKFTCKSRGTESNRSPEMLLTSQGRIEQPGASNHVSGSSSPSDIWALGCLLYELITKDLLYPEAANDYSRFHGTVTGVANEVLLSPERLHRVEHMPVIVDLLSYILKREPLRRPTASAIVARVQTALQAM